MTNHIISAGQIENVREALEWGRVCADGDSIVAVSSIDAALRILAALPSLENKTDEAVGVAEVKETGDCHGSYIADVFWSKASRGLPVGDVNLYTRPAPALSDDVMKDADRMRWGIENARWIRHEHEAYVAIPVALAANLSAPALRVIAIDMAMREHSRKNTTVQG